MRTGKNVLVVFFPTALFIEYIKLKRICGKFQYNLKISSNVPHSDRLFIVTKTKSSAADRPTSRPASLPTEFFKLHLDIYTIM